MTNKRVREWRTHNGYRLEKRYKFVAEKLPQTKFAGLLAQV
jgi:hypothetical protein